MGGLVHLGAHVGFDTLARAQDLALQVEGAAVLGLVGVEQSLEAAHDLLYLSWLTGWRLDVEDLACLVQCHAGADVYAAGGAAAVLGLRSLVLTRCRGLLVGFGEGAPQHAAADEDDLGDDAVCL